MKVTVERTSQTSVSLDIVADQDEFRRAMDRAYRRISQQVFIPGFRPGKAPRPLVERRIGREVIVEEAHREIMDDLYRRAIQQEEIVPVSQPEVDVYQDEPLGFRVAVQVYPEVDLGDYRSVRVEPREVTVSDEEIDEALKDLQERNGVWVEPKEPRRPQDGDQVIIDLEVKEDDQPLQEPIKGAEFVLGRSALFTEIEEAIKQLLPGATAEFDITFAEDDQRVSPEMRGKTLHYTVTLQEVKERELPPIDDELAKTVGEESLDALKQAIRRDLLRNRALEARTE
ncbi:MAG: trigger factor, partial [Thermomicrobiaceae bacterium]|nr:trigger factor [Thermomicrobiaceae bacterium]